MSFFRPFFFFGAALLSEELLLELCEELDELALWSAAGGVWPEPAAGALEESDFGAGLDASGAG